MSSARDALGDLPRLGFGSAPIGDLYDAVSEEVAERTVAAALARGVDLIDTAPAYGAGLAETRLGRALAGTSRSSYRLSTKVGRVIEDGRLRFDFSRTGILRALEGSMSRLATDHFEIVHLHDPDDHESQALREGFPTLAALRDEGVVGAIGAGMNRWPMLDRFLDAADFDVFLLAGRYTLLEQGARPFLDRCRLRNRPVLLGGVFNSGILALGGQVGAPHDYRPAAPDVLARVAAIESVCRDHHVALPAAAMQFAAAHPAAACVIMGASRPTEVTANVGHFHARIPPGFWSDLRHAGLIDADAPVPAVEHLGA